LSAGHKLDTNAPKASENPRKCPKSENSKGPVSIEETRPSEQGRKPGKHLKKPLGAIPCEFESRSRYLSNNNGL